MIVISLLLFAVGYAQEKDERDVGSFERIRVSQAIEVELVEGNDEKVTQMQHLVNIFLTLLVM